MFQKYYISILIIAYCNLNLLAQDHLELFLTKVEQNNKALSEANELLKAKQIAAFTGLIPQGPTISYENLPGTKAGYGNKYSFGISQSFEFPGIYSTKRKIAKDEKILNTYEHRQFRQGLLLHAKLSYLEYIYLLKKSEEKTIRLRRSEKMYKSSQKEFDLGNVSVIDLNKSKIQYLNQTGKLNLVISQIESKTKELELLCGDKILPPPDTSYSIIISENIDTLIQQMKQLDPFINALEINKQVSEKQILLKKQTSLPNFEIGYVYESEPEVAFSGVSASLTIPLWQHNNAIKEAKAYDDYVNFQIDRSLSEKINEIEKLYALKNHYAEILSEYRETLRNASNINFLEKALELGQLSIIEYINELSFYYNTIDEYLEIEFEYNKTDAILNSFRL